MSTSRELLHDLALPFRSFRILALERLIREGRGETVLRALEERRAVEDDDECRSLLEYALAAVAERSAAMPGKPETAGEFAARYASLDVRGKIAALSNLPADRLADLRHQATEWFFQETDLFLRAALLRTFRTVWPREALKPLLDALAWPAQAIRFAALETLVLHAPQELQRNLPALLTHEDPRIWALGIQGLAAIDTEEAVAHLDRMLESREPGTILAALRCSVFLPFGKLRTSFLRAIVENDDERVLEWIEEFLSTNPDPEVPFRLSEMELRAGGAKREILAGMTRRVTEELRKSTLLGDRWPAYQHKLAGWRTERQAIFRVRSMLQPWIDGETTPEAVAEILAPEWEKPEIQASLRAALLELTSAEIRSTLETWLQTGLPARAGSSLHDSRSRPSDGASPCERLAGLSADDREEARALIFPLLETASKAAIAEKTAAVRSAHRCGLADAASRIRPLLDSSDPALITSVLRFLAAFDFDALMPHLGRFLRSESTRVCFTALRILHDHDPHQSLSAVRAILREAKGPRQVEALGCLVMYEFSQVRDLLLDLLARYKNQELFDKALLLFKSNPDPENLYVLYKLEKDLDAANEVGAADSVRRVRQMTFDFLRDCNRLRNDTMGALEEEFARRRRLDEEEKRAKKPYGVRTLYPRKDETGSASGLEMRQLLSCESLLKTFLFPVKILREAAKEYPAAVISGALILSTACYLLVRSPAQPPELKRAQPLAAQVMTIEGMTRQVTGTRLVIRTIDGREYLLVPHAGGTLPQFPPDVRVRATIVPYRLEADNSIRGVCSDLVRVER